MATRSARLASSYGHASTTAAYDTLYTVPIGRTLIIKGVDVTRDAASGGGDVAVGVLTIGGYDWFYGTSSPAVGVNAWSGWAVANSGETIIVRSSTTAGAGTYSASLFGALLGTPTDPPSFDTGWRYFPTVSSTANYTGQTGVTFESQLLQRQVGSVLWIAMNIRRTVAFSTATGGNPQISPAAPPGFMPFEGACKSIANSGTVVNTGTTLDFSPTLNVVIYSYEYPVGTSNIWITFGHPWAARALLTTNKWQTTTPVPVHALNEVPSAPPGSAFTGSVYGY